MSYIEKEKLIKADIASIENRVRHAFNQGYDLGFKDGKEKAKPQEQEPRWIPISEKLPEESTAVLVWCPERKNIYCAYYEEKQWWIFGPCWIKVTGEIAAWRPLPISPNSEVGE